MSINKQRFKRILSFMFSILFVFSIISIPADANKLQDETIYNCEIKPSMRAEQLTYHYRTYNGRTQYRIWSITLGKWKTNWINC